jgi:hypothetical protein
VGCLDFRRNVVLVDVCCSIDSATGTVVVEYDRTWYLYKYRRLKRLGDVGLLWGRLARLFFQVHRKHFPIANRCCCTFSYHSQGFES